jgi:NAD(P)-dependent dehydrogenase (short-subunit alcohol dehydrogenase family)
MGFLRSQIVETRRLPYPEVSYAGQTIVITGSNTGLGKEAARHYARLGVKKLILAVRSLEKGHAAKKDIETTAAKGVEIQVWQLDLASYASINEFSARLEAELDRIDIFHANAGLVSAKYSQIEGNETNIAINVISTFLLVALILPKLKASAAQYGIRPTLVITSSGAHKQTKFPQKSEPNIFAALNDEHYANGAHWSEQYPISKLVGIFIVRAIAEEHPASSYPVTINLVSPGLCHSELSREAEGIQKVAFTVMKTALARPTEKGSRTLVHAGIQGPESHGQYLEDCHIAQPAPVVLENKKVQDQLWRELKAKLEEIQPGVTANF